MAKKCGMYIQWDIFNHDEYKVILFAGKLYITEGHNEQITSVLYVMFVHCVKMCHSDWFNKKLNSQ